VVATIVAPCLDWHSCGLDVGSVYKIRGLISRDDTCGTTWEFNPLLARTPNGSQLNSDPNGFQISGEGKVKSIAEVEFRSVGGRDYLQVMLSHQPTVSSAKIQWEVMLWSNRPL
jgi:hypothetical protein